MVRAHYGYLKMKGIHIRVMTATKCYSIYFARITSAIIDFGEMRTANINTRRF